MGTGRRERTQSGARGQARARRVVRAAAGAAVAAVLAAGCSDGPPLRADSPTPSHTSGAPAAPPATTGPASPGGTPSAAASAAPATGTAKVDATVASKLDSPWGMVQLADGTLLVGSRDTGRIVLVDPQKGTTTPVGTVPGVAHTQGGEAGLLGLALSPDFGTDHLLYAYFSTDSDNRIARMLYDPTRSPGDRLGAPDTILRGIPTGALHNGGRIAFGPDGMLYAGTGETGNRGLAQDMSSLGGKILRMTPDGQAPPDNPTPGSLVYSPGHRNVQGLAWDGQGRLWASEFGQDTWDELNLIEPGKNYGWPVVEGVAHRAPYVDPVVQWHTDEASPSGIAYAAGCIWMASLKGERLWRIPLDGTKAAAAPQAFFPKTYGRLRTVIAADDHTLLLTTSNTDGRGTPTSQDDRILRVTVT
ncbi:PQQ-dependent sugar dehydrogenase [Actinacidiphila epipremni]|uniref:PQQ-dependent sugar dehydrogenase n=1 Tax=Actinacidiphila epipremni TaxID=2053013 RepID=UPI002AFF1733|nr:PQQ-dependent sugar dehydrogenase [Actinacidiphila epipremni]